jgi:FkbH-like protein
MTKYNIPRGVDEFRELLTSRAVSTLDASDLLIAARRFEKIEEAYKEAFLPKDSVKRIAIVGSTMTSNFSKILRLYLYAEQISPLIYEAPFGSLNQQLLEEDSGLYRFSPDLILLLPDYRDVDIPPFYSVDEEQLCGLVYAEARRYRNLWNLVRGRLNAVNIVHALFAIPYSSPLGALDANQPFSPHNFLRRLNLKLIEKKEKGVIFIDFDYYASLVGKKEWFDPGLFHQIKQSIGFAGMSPVCRATAKLIGYVFGQTRKCLIVDLDNTLWGGVVGDDGLEGINLNCGDPSGEAFIFFQEYIKQLKERGVILAVCSKNESSTAKKPFQELPDMVLRLEDISCFVANWKDKAGNIRRISTELNIGLDSLVFFDDNPAERALIRSALPEVEVIDVPSDPARFVDALDESRCFDWATLTQEDIDRTKTYVDNSKRSTLEAVSLNYEEYLKGLSMIAHPNSSLGAICPRFNQLINKTNQFNMTGSRTTESKLKALSEAPEKYRLINTNLNDRFTNYGIISCMILKKCGSIALIETWVMSCRVFKRGVENLMLGEVINIALTWECDMLVGQYIPTEQNRLVENLYVDLGFNRGAPKHEVLQSLTGILYSQEIPSAKLLTGHTISIKR